MTDADTLGAAWWRRYRSVAERLDQPARMVALQRLVSKVDVHGPAVATPVFGAGRLTAARRVGLFAGSFNPLTLAHVALARAARRAAQLDLVVWASAAVTVDKEQVERASLTDRLAQMVGYTYRRRRDALVVLNRGLYVDEARALRTLLPQDAELTILIGFDKVVQIFDSRYYDDRDAALNELFAEASLLVAPREGAGKADLDALLAQPENQRYASRVGFMPLRTKYTRDSSTEARQRAARDPQPADLADLLPAEGAALAAGTSAYQPTTNSQLDPYALRQEWLRLLQDVPALVLKQSPTLSALVDRSLRQHE
jgi:nicotinamide-nucleotide adenylyltransferase